MDGFREIVLRRKKKNYAEKKSGLTVGSDISRSIYKIMQITRFPVLGDGIITAQLAAIVPLFRNLI